MDRTDIHRRALRAALQITFIAGAAGCEAPRRARPEPVTSYAATDPVARHTQVQSVGAPVIEERAACHPPTQATAPVAPVLPTQVAPLPPRPAPVPVAPVAQVDPAKACTDAAALSRGSFSPPVAACCDAVLTATEVAFNSGTTPPADYYSCCNFSGGSNASHRSVCSPWGPPAPPRMRLTLARSSLRASMARWS